MTVNTSKTVFQIFTLSPKPKAIQLFYGDYQLQRTKEATYLEIVLDSRLSWNKQASRVQAVGKIRNGMIKRLSGVKWGTTQDLLCTTYKSYIRPAIEYGSELLVTASEVVQNKIETVQNNPLRIITGGAFSTPILAMQLQENIESLTFRRKVGTLKLIERLMRHGDFWRNYNPADRRLKSQPTFLHVTKELSTDFDIPSPNRQPLVETGKFLRHLSPACYNSYLMLPVNKRSCIDTELRMAALATISKRFPETHWLHVYTDGSAAGANHSAGAGIYSRYFSISRAVGGNCTNYDGVLTMRAAVHMALTEVPLFCYPKRLAPACEFSISGCCPNRASSPRRRAVKSPSAAYLSLSARNRWRVEEGCTILVGSSPTVTSVVRRGRILPGSYPCFLETGRTFARSEVQW
ncbi:putative RNA-directed DNA polymerase from transposon BS [Trichonephila clavata]|uniref:Putative RNA-directed DNA polymerase from transposon BS n=1 Tax=Trichonephila clavata TaxID=2740835 RepID=A0A8X6HXY0_TRICU|nr:putative RNA-directed DNA polymerase from transposon BS [Trichonephila clavata]